MRTYAIMRRRGRTTYARLHGTGTWFEDDSHPVLFVFPCVGQLHFD